MKVIKGSRNQTKYELTKAEHQFLRDHWRELTDKQLLAAFNKRFGCEMTFGYLRQYKRANDLIQQAQPAWTEEEVEFLKANYQRMGNVEIAAHFGWTGEQCGRKYGEKRIWKKMKQLGLKRSKRIILKLRQECGKKVMQEARSKDKNAYSPAATLTDAAVVHTLTHMQQDKEAIKKFIKEHPELIELQRQRILLNRKINKIEKNGK